MAEFDLPEINRIIREGATRLGDAANKAAEAIREFNAAVGAIERERFMLSIRALLPLDRQMAAEALADHFGFAQLELYVRLLAEGAHYESAALLVGRMTEEQAAFQLDFASKVPDRI